MIIYGGGMYFAVDRMMTGKTEKQSEKAHTILLNPETPKY